MVKTDSTIGTRFIDSAKLKKSLSNSSPQIRGLTRNMVKDDTDPSRNTADREGRVKYSKLKSLSDIIANNINAATDLRQITPYIAKAELIWKTLLLYPNGAQDSILTYDTHDSKFKNTALHNELNSAIRRYFTSDYKIERLLPKVVSELTCGSGSYIRLNLSRPAVDHIINGQQRFEDRSGTENFQLKRKEIEKEFVRVENTETKKVRWLARNKGLVRNPETQNVTGIESLFSPAQFKTDQEYFPLGEDFGITITDNPSVLALAALNQDKVKQKIDTVMGVESLSSIIEKRRKSKEDNTIQTSSKVGGTTKAKGQRKSAVNTAEMSDAQLEALQQDLYGGRDYVRKPVASIRLSDSYSIKPFGVPLTFDVPSEAFIPCHMDGDPTKQVGGFLLLDPDGGVLKSTKDFTFNQSVKGQNGKIDTPNQQGSTNNLISNLRRVQEGSECDFDMSEFAILAKDQIEKSLVQAIASGVAGKTVTVSLEEEALKIYLSRAFKQQGVRCLYVPAECYTYFAFNYNRMGIGQSMTTRAKMFIARLAALDVADALANLDAAQTRNELTIGVEENDPDPEHTIELSRSKWFQANPTMHTLISAGSLSVPDIVEAFRQNTLVVRVDGSQNPFLPAPNISVQQVDRTGFKGIDDNARQNLLSSIASTFMLQRSWLDDKEDGNNFQIEALAEQEMLRNQTVLWGNQLGEMISDMIRKHTALNGPLLNELLDIIDSNKALQKPDSKETPELEDDEELVEILLADYLNNIRVTLPQPASTESTNKLKDKIQAVNDLVTGWIEMSGGFTIMETALTSAGISTEGMTKEEIAATVKGVFLIDLYKRMNLPMPFDAVANKGQEGGLYSLINEIGQYRNNIYLFIESYAKANKKQADKFKTQMDKILETNQSEENTFENGDQNNEQDPNDNPDDPNLEDDGSLDTSLDNTPTEQIPDGSEIPEGDDGTKSEDGGLTGDSFNANPDIPE